MVGIRRRNLAIAILVTAAVLLTAAAAAPLFDVEQGGDGPPRPENPDGGSAGDPGIDPTIPVELIAAVVVVLAAIAIVAQFVRNPRRTFLQILGLSILLVGLFALFETLGELTARNGSRPPAGPRNATPTIANETGFGDGETNPLSLPAGELAVIVLVAGLLGIVVLLTWRSGTVRSMLGRGPSQERTDREAGLTDVRDLAGNVADDVEAASSARAADNAIYRAWREMVELLEASDPRSATPRQFAEAATDAGMDPDAVAVLTETFEEVRYGDAPLSEARRERAVRALREIEAAHDAESGGVTAVGSDDGNPGREPRTAERFSDRDGDRPGGGE